MAHISEEDRKAILGKDWKPLVEEKTSSGKMGLQIAALAGLIAVAIGYGLVNSGQPKPGSAGAPVAAMPAASPAVSAVKAP